MTEATRSSRKATADPKPEVQMEVQSGPRQEFSSITITLDHLYNSLRQDGHCVVKMIFSTESAKESLVSMLSYFNMHHLFAVDGVVELIAALGRTSGVAVLVAVGSGGPLTNIIVDAAVWRAFLRSDKIAGGSTMELVNSLAALALDMQRAARARGDLTPLQVYSMEGEGPDAVEEA